MQFAKAMGLILTVLFLVTTLAWAQEADTKKPGVPEAILSSEIAIDELALRLTPLTVAELAAAAEAWREIVKDKTNEVVAAQIAATRAEGDDQQVEAQGARERLAELVAERGSLFDRYSTVIDSWEKKGGDETAIAEFRAYRNSIIVEETRTADFKTLVSRAIAWITAEDGGVDLGINVMVVIAALFGLLLIARMVRRLVRRHIARVPNLSKLLQAFIVGVIYWLVLAFGLMVVLSGLGIDISPVFALVIVLLLSPEAS